MVSRGQNGPWGVFGAMAQHLRAYSSSNSSPPFTRPGPSGTDADCEFDHNLAGTQLNRGGDETIYDEALRTRLFRKSELGIYRLVGRVTNEYMLIVHTRIRLAALRTCWFPSFDTNAKMWRER